MNEGRYREAEERLWASVGVTPTERCIRLEPHGVEMRVQEVGQGPPVLFVHGGSNNGTSWATLAVHLTDFRCILLDRPGCGLSEPLGTVLDVDGLTADPREPAHQIPNGDLARALPQGEL
jgi:2-hydroxy-6-oxonona-2,4-dienedioate hydrolase